MNGCRATCDGLLIVLEGLDGSGKSTQFELLCHWLEEQGQPFQRVSFPRYGTKACSMVEAYLNGEFGTKPEDVNPYAGSTFYAVDRYASFKTEPWGEFYRQGGLILSARYTTSNACHQTSKLPAEERGPFLDWLADFEFRKLGIPSPDLVLYLDISVELSMKRVFARSETTHMSRDIHEKSREHLIGSLSAGEHAAAYYGWQVVPNEIDDWERTVEEIQEELRQRVAQFLRSKGRWKMNGPV